MKQILQKHGTKRNLSFLVLPSSFSKIRHSDMTVQHILKRGQRKCIKTFFFLFKLWCTLTTTLQPLNLIHQLPREILQISFIGCKLWCFTLWHRHIDALAHTHSLMEDLLLAIFIWFRCIFISNSCMAAGCAVIRRPLLALVAHNRA